MIAAYLGSIEPVISTVLFCMHGKRTCTSVRTGKGRSTNGRNQENNMISRQENLRHGRAMRCAVCDGKFGLVRHYQWQTPLCSRKCIDRFRARRESDRNWVGWLQIACGQPTENRASAL